MGNKNIEKDCIDKALKYSKSQHGKSKRIINLLNGIDVEREYDERPDFVKVTTDINGEQIILGIEHFQVNCNCIKKKNGKYAGTDQKYKKDLQNLYNHYHDLVVTQKTSNEEACFQAFLKILDIGSKQSEYSFNSTYEDFIDNFNQKLNSHANNIDIYYQTIKKYKRNAEKTKLMFLIDIVGNYNALILNAGKNVRRINTDELPLFSEIVNSLINVVENKIDYIVFCLGNNEHTRVIAIEANSISNELNKQNIKIFDYLNFESFLPFNSNVKCEYEILEKNDKAINVAFKCTSDIVDINVFADKLFENYYSCYQARKQKKNFITNIATQFLLDVYAKYIIQWKISTLNAEIKYRPKFQIQDYGILKQEEIDFYKTWGIDYD